MDENLTKTDLKGLSLMVSCFIHAAHNGPGAGYSAYGANIEVLFTVHFWLTRSPCKQEYFTDFHAYRELNNSSLFVRVLTHRAEQKVQVNSLETTAGE